MKVSNKNVKRNTQQHIVELQKKVNLRPKKGCDTRSIFKGSSAVLNSELLSYWLPNQGWRTKSAQLVTHNWIGWLVGWLVGWSWIFLCRRRFCFIRLWFGLVLWHINLCRLFNAKSIFIHINSYVSNNSVLYKYSFFFIYTHLNVKTVISQTNQFGISKQFKC